MAFKLKEDERFKQGRAFLNSKNYEEAINTFSSLVQYCNTEFGEMSLQSAQAFYEYGNALLLAEEENSSNEVLGNVDHGDDGEAPQDEDCDDKSENNENEEPAEGDELDDAVGDVQVAWESLDVARHILANEKDPAKRDDLLLSDIYVRLGDLMRFNGNMAESIEEYHNALRIREHNCKNHDSMISDVHYSLAIAYIYNASEKEVVDPVSEKNKALKHYKLARDSIKEWIRVHETQLANQQTNIDNNNASSSDNNTKSKIEEDIKDKNELVDMLQETIDALIVEIKETVDGKKPTVDESMDGVTTIGFGKPTFNANNNNNNSSSTGVPSTVFSNNNINKLVNITNITTAATATSVNEVNTLQIKKKKRTNEDPENVENKAKVEKLN